MANHTENPAVTKPENAPRSLALIVEDLPDIRDWLGHVLERTFEDIEVVKVGSLAAAREWLDSASPEVIARGRLALVDLGLPDGSGVDLIAELAEQHPHILPIVASIFDDDAHLFDAIAAGAQGYLLKDKDAAMLIEYLLRIERGEPPLSPAMARRIMSYFRQKPAGQSTPQAPAAGAGDGLTTKEADVLELIGSGSRLPEAAARMGLSEFTVAAYVKGIYDKLRGGARIKDEPLAVSGWRSKIFL